MASQEVAVFILCLGLIWVWMRRRQHYRAARERQCSEETICDVLLVSSTRIGYNYCAGNTAYTARQCTADKDSMGERQESHILR